MKQLLILSGKGGTGKTTTAAAFIRFAGAKAMADCDVDAPNLEIVTNFKENPQVKAFTGSDKARIDSIKCIGCKECALKCRFGAIKTIGNICVIDEYACEGCGVCSYVCPQGAVSLLKDVAGEQQLYCGEKTFSTARLKMGRGNSGKLVSAVKQDMVKNSPEEAELAIIDGSPGIGCPVIASVSGVDLVLVVAEPSMSGLSDLERLVKTANNFGTKMAVCVNKWDISPENTVYIEEFCKEKGLAFVGKVPYDKSASAAINSGLSVAEFDCPARDALKDVYINTIKLL